VNGNLIERLGSLIRHTEQAKWNCEVRTGSFFVWRMFVIVASVLALVACLVFSAYLFSKGYGIGWTMLIFMVAFVEGWCGYLKVREFRDYMNSLAWCAQHKIQCFLLPQQSDVTRKIKEMISNQATEEQLTKYLFRELIYKGMRFYVESNDAHSKNIYLKSLAIHIVAFEAVVGLKAFCLDVQQHGLMSACVGMITEIPAEEFPEFEDFYREIVGEVKACV